MKKRYTEEQIVKILKEVEATGKLEGSLVRGYSWSTNRAKPRATSFPPQFIISDMKAADLLP